MIKRAVKALLCSFTFWFVLISLLTIYNHYSGGDSKSIILISFHPVLRLLSHNDAARDWLNAGPMAPARTILGAFSVRWYLAHLLCSFVIGDVLDAIKSAVRHRARRRSPAPATEDIKS